MMAAVLYMDNFRSVKMKELLQLLSELRSDVDFEKENSLIDDSVLDSFDVVTIIAEINERFNVEISVDDISADNFNSAEKMYSLINKLQEKQNG